MEVNGNITQRTLSAFLTKKTLNTYMSRPAPNIIIESIDSTSYKSTQVIESEGIWAVYYQNRPINVKTLNAMTYSIPKYKKISFPNAGHAINMAKKLNKQFNTTDFTVVKFTHAETIFAE